MHMCVCALVVLKRTFTPESVNSFIKNEDRQADPYVSKPDHFFFFNWKKL